MRAMNLLMEEFVMKKKILAIVMSIVLVAGIVCAFAACGNEPANNGDAKASDLAYIKEKGTMVIGITDYAPMNYKDADGNWTGFDTEFAEAVCAKLGVKAEFFVLSDWDQKVNELNAKTIDVVWNGMTIRDDLKTSMSISNPYVVNAQVIVTKAENAEKYKDAEGIKEAAIAVESGSAGESEASKVATNVIPVKTQADTLVEVKSGSADCAVIDITMAKAMTGEGTDYADLTYTGSLSEEFYGIGFRVDSDVCAEVNGIIKDMKADGSLQKLADKYNLTLAD
jgi:polar amino acid transport system substrate-binding protein